MSEELVTSLMDDPFVQKAIIYYRFQLTFCSDLRSVNSVLERELYD